MSKNSYHWSSWWIADSLAQFPGTGTLRLSKLSRWEDKGAQIVTTSPPERSLSSGESSHENVQSCVCFLSPPPPCRRQCVCLQDTSPPLAANVCVCVSVCQCSNGGPPGRRDPHNNLLSAWTWLSDNTAPLANHDRVKSGPWAGQHGVIALLCSAISPKIYLLPPSKMIGLFGSATEMSGFRARKNLNKI